MNRRDALKTLCVAGASTLAGKSVEAKPRGESVEFVSMLIDTTRCIGCRSCEEACAETNKLPMPDVLDDSVFERVRETSTTQYTVVNRFEVDGNEIFVKRQCMHCAEPACASACLTKAMLKTREGPVINRKEKCMGCRFCMVSCPFNMPKFEYEKAIPAIRKCTMCWDRLQQGEQPACVENCPAEALLFGKRRDLVETAKQRIYGNPDSYVHHIYGEHEAGGTCVMYLASVPFEKLGFDTSVGTEPYPPLTKEFLYGVPVVLTLWPAFLYAVGNSRKQSDREERDEIDARSG